MIIPTLVVQQLLLVVVVEGTNPPTDCTPRHTKSSAEAAEHEEPSGRCIMLAGPTLRIEASLHVRQSSLCCVLFAGAGNSAQIFPLVCPSALGKKVWVTLFTRDFVGASSFGERVRNDAGRCMTD